MEALVSRYQGEIVNLRRSSNETIRGILVEAKLLGSQNNFVGKGRVPSECLQELGGANRRGLTARGFVPCDARLTFPSAYWGQPKFIGGVS